METLESRNLLAANVLASVEGSIGTAGATNDVLMTLTLPDASPLASATLQINVVTTEGGFNPAAVTITDEDSNAVPATEMDDVNGTTASMTVVDLTEGTYTLTVADSTTAGNYRLDVSMLGDVEGDDGGVSEFEELRTSAALIQALGTSNFVTELLYRNQGIDLDVDQYDAGMDANGNGRVDEAELTMVQENATIGSAVVTLQADAAAPVISNLRLVNDTGNGSDGITTDPTLTAEIADDNLIDELLISIDGGAEVNIRDMLGDLPGSFELSEELLESVNGGPLSEGSHTVALSATDSIGNTNDTPITTTFVLIIDNEAPASTGIDDVETLEDAPVITADPMGESMTLDVSSSFVDPDQGDVLTFTATGLPRWASLSAAGIITGTPTNDDVSTTTVTITATDSQGATVSDSFELTVINVNDAPTVDDIDNQTAALGVLFELNILASVTDIDVGDEVAVSVDQLLNNLREDLPDWLAYDTESGILSGTPGEGDVGTITIVVTAVDSEDGFDENMFDLTVTSSTPPELVSPIPDDSLNQGERFSLDLNDFFVDNDPGDSLTFDVTLVGGGALPSWLNLTEGVLAGVPDNDDVGEINLEATATDTEGASASDQFMLTVNNVNDAPTMEDQDFGVPMGGTNGTSVGTIVANDIDDGDTLTFSVTGGSGQAAYAVNEITGEITIADASNAFSQDEFTLNATVTDNSGLTANAVMTLNITNTNPTPSSDDGFSTSIQSELTILSSALLANDTDPEGDTLSVAMVELSSNLGGTVSISDDRLRITYDPSTSATLAGLAEGESMTDTFTYTVIDGRGGEATATVSVLVKAAIVEFTTSFEDAAGNVITSVAPGQTFQLVISVQDIRENPAGVFSAYVDVNYPAALVSVDGTFTNSMTYAAGASGSTSMPGLLDEVGGTDGISPLGGDVFEVSRITMRAGMTPGAVTFTGDLADDLILHPVTVFDITAAQPDGAVVVRHNTLTIEESVPAPLGFSQTAPATNPVNALDVNADGVVSPLDALMLIGQLNGVSESYAGIMYTDVNGDGVTSPIDALLVIGQLNGGSTARAAMSASAAPSGSSDLATDLANDAVFESLETSATELTSPESTESVGSGIIGNDDAEDEADDVDAVMSDLGDLPF